MALRVPGFVAGAVASGLKKDGKKDLGIIFSEVPACAAGVFTTNQVQAAPVLLDGLRRLERVDVLYEESLGHRPCAVREPLEQDPRIDPVARPVLDISAE